MIFEIKKGRFSQNTCFFALATKHSVLAKTPYLEHYGSF
jgi:hypothetical protein